jgi:hypothetical protein
MRLGDVTGTLHREGSKMIPNEVLAAWIVAATTGAAALGGLSLLDSRPSAGGLEAEPLPFYDASTGTQQRLPPLTLAWRSRLEATGSLPVHPAVILADWGDDEVDGRHMNDELFDGSPETTSVIAELVGP